MKKKDFKNKLSEVGGLGLSSNFRPNALLGQNFLMNQAVLHDIVDAAELRPGDEVLEIGSGIGNLTKLLAEKAGFVLGIEKDQRFFPILKEELGDHLRSHTKTAKSKANVQIVFADAMSFNFQELLKPGYKVVANIPYYITGKIVEMLMTAKNRPSRMVLLMQKEVAERIIAKAGEMSILAISVQLFSKPKLVSIVPAEDFYPAPKVDSAVLVLEMLPKPKFDIDQKKFFKIIKAAFLGKRKQIHNTLKNNLRVDEKKLAEVFRKGNIDPKARPQELNLDQWYFLYQNLAEY